MTFQKDVEAICDKLHIPQPVTNGFLEFCSYYEASCKKGGTDPHTLLPLFSTFLSSVQKELKNPYVFGPYHRAIFSPIDYYQLGLDFVRPMIDHTHSMLLGKKLLSDIQLALQNKENVVLLANHQTEIDPQIISLLLEQHYPQLARDMIFVAGHRVVTDPLAVPFSLGRNLICIYSKRHVETPIEKKAEKLAHNQKALKALEDLFNDGGKCIYVAPSGGRDRVDAHGIPQVAPFDPQSIELFYLLSQKARHATHFYPLTLATYNLLPPPQDIQTQIGEKRTTSFSPAHVVFGERIDMQHIGECHKVTDKKEKRAVRAQAIWQLVASDYESLPIKKAP